MMHRKYLSINFLIGACSFSVSHTNHNMTYRSCCNENSLIIKWLFVSLLFYTPYGNISLRNHYRRRLQKVAKAYFQHLRIFEQQWISLSYKPCCDMRLRFLRSHSYPKDYTIFSCFLRQASVTYGLLLIIKSGSPRRSIKDGTARRDENNLFCRYVYTYLYIPVC